MEIYLAVVKQPGCSNVFLCEMCEDELPENYNGYSRKKLLAQHTHNFCVAFAMGYSCADNSLYIQQFACDVGNAQELEWRPQ